MKDMESLRVQAMDLLSKKEVDTEHWGTDVKKLVEELSIYQIELEHQNEALRLSQNEIRQMTDGYIDLFENAPLSYLVVSPEGVILQANGTFYKTFHIFSDKVIGSRFDKFIQPIYQDSYYYFFNLLCKKKVKTHIELKVVFDTAPMNVEVYALSHGQSSNLRFALIDKTQQKKLEVQLGNETMLLKKSESRFRQIVEQSTEVFVYLNYIDYKIDYISPHVSDLLEYTVQEVLSMDDMEAKSLILTATNGEVVPDFAELDESLNGRIDKIFEMRTKSGRSVWVKGSYLLIKSDAGVSSQIMCCLSDVTDDKIREYELIRAKQVAEENDNLKSAFLANISHEIRTPLNSIIGFAHILCEEMDKEKEYYQYVDIIQTCGNRLLSLIDNIICISKIESRQMGVTESEFDLSELFNDTYNLFAPEARKKGLELRFHKDKITNIIVETDKSKLTTIVYNLVKNAIKYTVMGYVEFGCSIKDDELLLFVSDTGIGIPKEKQAIIFDRFSQVNETGYREGVGLGLSISKGMVELLNGTIELESEEDEGSTFRVSIPIRKQQDAQTSVLTDFDNCPDLNGLYIMVAEDDFYSSQLLMKYLLPTNARVGLACDGVDLMESIENECPNLILLDINMPRKNGSDCIPEIRNKFQTKILVQTAYAQEGDAKRFINMGADDYIAKPVKKDELYQKIGVLMSSEK